MYQTILVTLDATPTDRAIIDHVKQLAKTLGSRVVLLHVATGVPAQVQGEDAAGQEIEDDHRYLQRVKEEFEAQGIAAQTCMAYNDPVREIVKWVENNPCDLLAMATHGHSYVGDFVYGSTVSPVRHRVNIPVLLVRAQ